MSTVIFEYINESSRALVSAGASHLVQSVLVAGTLVAIDHVVGRRLGAPWRCGLWLIFFVKLALPPWFALPSSPAYWIGSDPVANNPPARVSAMPDVSRVAWDIADPATYDSGAAVQGAPQTMPREDPELSWQTLLVGGWAAVALALGLATLARRRRLRAELHPVVETPARVQEAFSIAAAEAGCGARCRLQLVDSAVGPLVTGLWRPTVYLPRHFADRLPPEQLHGVLLHECLHVRRGDLWVAAIQTMARILFFYNPAVWWVNAHLARLREEATDRAVLAHPRIDAQAYNLALVAAAELGLGLRPVSSLALGVIETKSQLKYRIQMNMTDQRSRRTGIGRPGLLALGLLGLVILPMAPAGSTQSGTRMPSGFQPIDGVDTARRIDAASERIFAAFNHRDRDAYVAAFTADAQILPPGRPLQTGYAGAAEGYFQAPPGLQYEDIRWKDRVCYQIGAWLIDTGLAELRFRPNIDAPIMADPRQALTIWEADDRGNLQVKVLAWNPLPQPPDFAPATVPQAFAFTSPGATPVNRGEFPEVIQAEEAVHRAFEERRTSDAASYYASEAIFFTPETQPLRGHAAIRSYITAVPAERSAQRIERTLAHVEGNENHVLVVNLFRWSFTPPGSSVPVSITGKGVHLWQRDPDGSWKILLDLPNPSQPTGG